MTHIVNENFDALIRQADEELDAERRIAHYEDAGHLLVRICQGSLSSIWRGWC
jgi:hypothetical protein